MLRAIAERCTQVLIDHRTISSEMRNIYIYGFELFWSTTFCIISILALGAIFGLETWQLCFCCFLYPYGFRREGIMRSLMEDVLSLQIL